MRNKAITVHCFENGCRQVTLLWAGVEQCRGKSSDFAAVLRISDLGPLPCLVSQTQYALSRSFLSSRGRRTRGGLAAAGRTLGDLSAGT